MENNYKKEFKLNNNLRRNQIKQLFFVISTIIFLSLRRLDTVSDKITEIKKVK